ncbi:MAG: hypothetical protein ACKVOL_08130 [Novosphingobium sp.]
MIKRTPTHRRHPAYDARPAHPEVSSSAFAAQLIVAALSFAVLVGAAFHALQVTLGS